MRHIPCPGVVMIISQLINFILNTLKLHVETAMTDADVDTEVVKCVPVVACICLEAKMFSTSLVPSQDQVQSSQQELEPPSQPWKQAAESQCFQCYPTVSG
jgi:hypothetical protein